jgi:anti-sigma regulatory factor (Ser/Thr protein kinase)
MTICFELPVSKGADVALARYRSGEAAVQLGFSSQRRAEVRLIASELARNHLDHTTACGIIRITGQQIDGLPVLTIASLDQGPGIAHLNNVLQGAEGGYRSDTGLGTGLASVMRLADRFSCCSETDTRGCFDLPGIEGQGTVITARCYPEPHRVSFFNSSEVDLAALVCGHTETLPCGDGIFVSSDSRFLRIVLVDSPGRGRGRGETELIGSMLAELNLVWPPDHVMESLAEVFAAEPATAVLVLRADRLLGEVRCCRAGDIGIHLLLDNRLISPPESLLVEQGGLIRGKDSLFKVAAAVSCVVYSDGIRSLRRPEAEKLLRKLARRGGGRKQTGAALDPALLAQIIFSGNRQIRDDAALCVWHWQRT